ncbi:Vitamin B12 transporter BtuB [bioreactor metagenome]|uniref:Vitamin B12 transporter BtuB n=1 Tax=bioreactor metagenome TaxID=1076179 RepID=A0A644TIH8_9ZZZZ
MNKTYLKRKNAFRFKRFANKSYSAYNSMHKVVSIGVLSFATLTCAAQKEAVAQGKDTIKINQIADKNLDEVVIWASADEPVNQVAKIITTITREEIGRLRPQSIQDLLSYAASVDIQTRGSHGVQADVSIRGGSFDQSAILLNGINISNPQTGHYSFDIPINISDIERIEILHSPSAIVYGASAFSGGINIITKKNIDKELSAKVEGGSYGLFAGEIGGAYRIKNVDNRLSMGYKQSDGYIENSDYRIFNLLYGSRVNLKENKIDIQLGYNKKNYGANTFYSAAYPNQYDNTSSVLTSVKGEFGSKLKFLPSIYWNRHYDRFELIKNSGKSNNHRSDVLGSNLNMQYHSKLGLTNFGLELRNESILSNVLGLMMSSPIGDYTKKDNRLNLSYMLQHNIKYKGFTMAMGVLGFENTAFKQAFKLYPSLSVDYKINNNINVFSSYSQSSRLPTFTDLYYTTKTHIGNTDLKQEESESVELGSKYRNRYFLSYVSGFWLGGKNMIDWVKKNPDDKWESKNITQISKFGLEVGVKLFLNEIISSLKYPTTLKIDYSRMHQEVIKNEYISNYALNYLRDKLTAQLYLPLYKDKLSTTVSFRYQKRMGQYLKYEDLKPAQKEDYPAFTTMDISINYNLKNFNIYCNMNNIFNTKYFDLGNVPQPGFWLIGGVSINL